MTNQNECDHILGHNYDQRDPVVVTKSEKQKYGYPVFVAYNFCPDCGKKLKEE